MHGMLSLGVLVAAFAGLAGWAAYLSVRLYRACPAARSPSPQPPAFAPAADTDPAGPDPVGPDPADPDLGSPDPATSPVLTLLPGAADDQDA